MESRRMGSRSRPSVTDAEPSTKKDDIENRKRGKKHPPPPKPRPVPPAETAESKITVDLECSTSEDEDTSVRRAPRRQSKKQKRLEVKEDRTVLGEMKNPLPSTSGPLIREQEKIRLMYPRRFVQSEGGASRMISGISPHDNPLEVDENSKATPNRGATRKSAMKKSGGGPDNQKIRPTRSSSRRAQLKPVSDDDGKEEANSPVPVERLVVTTPKRSETDNTIKKSKSMEIYKSPTVPAACASPISNCSTPVVVPVLNEKRQRRIPKRLMSPDMADLPPLLFRIGSIGSVNNINDEDDEPPKLKPMLSPQTPRLKTGPGKENQLVGKEIEVIPSAISPGNSAVLQIEESGHEPARKRIARSRSASESAGNLKNIRNTRQQSKISRNRSPANKR